MSTTAAGGHSRLIPIADYTGRLGRDALAEISAARLIATIEPTRVDVVEQAGLVLGQEPPAGQQLRRGQMVILYVGDHPDASPAPPRAPRRPERPSRATGPHRPTLFDASVGIDAQPTPDVPVSPAPAVAARSFPFPERPRQGWPAEPAPEAPSATTADPDETVAAPLRFRARQPRAAAPVGPEAVAEPEPYPEDIPDVQLAGHEASARDDLTEVLDPDQVSDAAVLERNHREAPRRHRRPRPRRRLGHLSGRQKLAAAMSTLVILYLAATLVESRPAHRAALGRRVTHVAPPAPGPSTTTPSAMATTTVPTLAPAPRRAHHRSHPPRHAAAHSSVPASPTPPANAVSAVPATPAAPVSSARSVVPTSSPMPAAPSNPTGQLTRSRSASSGSPLSPIGPIAPAPNQP